MGHRRTITDADRAAAARLRSLWLAIPKDRRPTQQAIADAWTGGGEANQSLVSQYMNGKLALNFRAVLSFAQALGCAPGDIRNDLPEQRHAGGRMNVATEPRRPSQPARLDPATIGDAMVYALGELTPNAIVFDANGDIAVFIAAYNFAAELTLESRDAFNAAIEERIAKAKGRVSGKRHPDSTARKARPRK